MADRRQWVKLWATWYTSASHLGVGAMALHVGAVLMTCVQWAPGDDAAWAELDTGKPLPVEAIAHRCQASAKDVAKALADLELRGTVSQRSDGAWGFLRFGRWQETPDAARKRRGKSTDVPRTSAGKSAKFPREEEAEEEADAELATLVPPTPASGGVTVTGGKAKTPRARKPPRQLDLRAVPVLEHVDACRQELGLRPLPASERTDRQILARLDEGVTVDLLLAALDARLELARQDPSDGQWLNATSPFTGPGTRGPGGWHVSMRALDRVASGTGLRPSGPAWIGPRIPHVDEVLAQREADAKADAEMRAKLRAQREGEVAS